MRKTTAWMLALILGGGGSLAGAVEPTAVTTEVISQPDGLTVIVRFDLTRLTHDPANGGALSLPGCDLTREPGGWALPEKVLEVVFPLQTEVRIQDIQVQNAEFPDGGKWVLSRLPQEHPDADGGIPPVYPLESVELRGVGYHHGVHRGVLVLHPVQLVPATGRFRGVTTLTIRLVWSPAPVPVPFVRPRVLRGEAVRVRAHLGEHALNKDQLVALDVLTVASVGSVPAPTYIPGTPTGAVEGVVICPEAARAVYQHFVDEKVRTGRAWDLVTYEWVYAQGTYRQGTFKDEPEAIREFLKEAYQTYGLEMVMFGGTPPTIRATYKNWYYRNFDEVESLGYYANLDGDHRLVTTSFEETSYVTFHSWDHHQYTATSGPRETVVGERCGRAEHVSPEWQVLEVNPLILDYYYAPAGYFIAQNFLQAHPEYVGRTIWIRTSFKRQRQGCDLSRELTVAWLPMAPDLGSTGVGLYLEKLRRYREPVDPDRLMTIVNDPWYIKSWLAEAARAVFDQQRRALIPEFRTAGLNHLRFVSVPEGAYTHGDFTNEFAWGVGAYFDHVCPGEWGASKMVVRTAANLSLLNGLQSSGLYVHDTCAYRREPSGASSYASGLWVSPFTNFVLHPEGGAVASLYPLGRFEPAGPAWYGGVVDFPFYLGSSWSPLVAVHAPLSRLMGLYQANKWSEGHRAVYAGDPTIAMWTAPPTRLIVTHPDQVTSAFSVALRNQMGDPVPGAEVVFSKRRPNGSYAWYNKQITDAEGQVTGALPIDPRALGAGVLSVEASVFTVPGHQDYYPYHGAVALEVNTPPTLPDIPTEMPLTTSDGGWVILDASAAADADGDHVTLTWDWTDYRTGVGVARQDSGRWIRVFLQPGANRMTLTASDGAAISKKTFNLSLIRGLDRTPPEARMERLVAIPPVGGWVAVPITLNQTQLSAPWAWTLNFIATDPPHLYWQDGPVPLGVAGWRPLRVEASGASPVAASLAGNQLWIQALPPLPDGPPRKALVTVEVWDRSGNITQATGEVVIEDRQDPQLSARTPLQVPPSGGWVGVPLRMVAPGTPPDPASLEWEGWDPVSPGVSPLPLSWRVKGIVSNDPTRPQPIAFRLTGSTLEVEALPNWNGTLRSYTVTLQAVDGAGRVSRERSNYIHVLWPNSLRYSGKVYGVAEVPGELIPEPGVLVELQTLDGRWVTRTQTGTNGTWQFYAPSLTGPGTGYHFRASKGGRDFRYHLESLTLGNGTLLPESWTTGPAGLTLAYKNTLDWDDRLTVSVARLVTNRPPIARVAHPTLEVVSSTPSTLVTLDGRLSSDPDRDLLQGYWFWSNNPERLSYVYPGLLTQGPFPQGVTEVEFSVSDGTAESRTRFYVWVHPSVIRDPTTE